MLKARTEYPRGNDEPTPRRNVGEVSGDFSEQDEAEEIYTDATLLDQKVRELIESTGAHYDFGRAVENGTARKITENGELDGDLYDALHRLERAAPILNAAVETVRRREMAGSSPLANLLMRTVKGRASGSRSGSLSGSTSGSESGSASGSERGQVSKAVVLRALQGHVEDALRLMGRR